MNSTKEWTVAESNAFIEEFELGPWSSGTLSGLKFAVSDLIDIEERPTGCGNPAWLEQRPPAACNALCVDILLSSGAQCIGKTKSDEFTFSLLGQSSFTGTPLNPRAPERVPGGSSSGAASAVACGHVNFAISLDSGASTQVSANNCGLFGWRSKPGKVPMAGILPVSPSFDTLGVLASSASALGPVAELLSCVEMPILKGDVEIFLLTDAWSKANESSKAGLQSALERLEDCAARQARELSLKRICSDNGGNDLQNWYQTYFELFCMESWSSIGTWVEDRKPELGQEARANVHRARMTDRSESVKFYKRRELFSQAINEFLAQNKIICIPASSELAPKKGFIPGVDDPGNYQQTMLSLASLSAIGRLAQLTIPLSESNGVPVGLSLLASNESVLLGLLKQIST